MALEVRFLGGLEVRVDAEVVPLGGPQAQTVFALLAAEPGTTVPTSGLVDELWPTDPPQNALGTIQTHIATIRRGLGDARGRLRTHNRGYVLDLARDELDAAQFVALVREGHDLLTSDAGAARERLEAGLALWRGEPLGDLADRARRLAAEATRLREVRLTAVEDLAAVRLHLGEHTAVIADLGPMVDAAPFRERALELLLRALAAAGRHPEALGRYLDHRRRLADELGVDPSAELQRLHLELLGAAPQAADAEDPSPADALPAGRLPSFHTRLFGREDDVATLVELVTRERLLTISGAGGTGKTRVAVELARRSGPDYPDGVHFVDLVPVHDAALVGRTIARSLGPALSPLGGSALDEAVRMIGGRRVLLVLDNCEHLLEACADHVRRLLDDCPRLTVLATSREPLGVDGERRWRLDPLTLPGDDDRDTAASMQLLVDRAQAVRRDFRVTDDNRAALAAICRQLDGLPLALELIAARLEHLSAAEVAARLGDQPQAMVRGRGPRRPPRHRTLEDTIGWSYDLLPDDEQALLRRLSVFAGGATLQAVTAVAEGDAGELDVLELISGLVRRSLVTVREVAGTTRYGLLETIRQFAEERLRAGGEEEAARRAHRDHYLERLESVPWDQRLFSFHGVAPTLEPELGNLRAALRASIAYGERDLAARLAVGCPAFVISSQHWDEFDRWLGELWAVDPAGLSLPERVRRASCPEHLVHHFWIEVWRLPLLPEEVRETLAVLRDGAEQLPTSSPARILLEHVVGVGALWFEGVEPDRGLPRLVELAEAAREADAPLLQAVILDEVALLQLLAGRAADAVATLRSCPLTEVADHYDKPLATLAVAQHLAGEHDAAIRTVELNHRLTLHPGARSLGYVLLAIAVAGSGDLASAHDLLRRAREEHERLRWAHPRSINDLLVGLGACAVLEGRRDVAARLLAAAGSPAEGFKPMTAIHLHYARAAGPPPPEERPPSASDATGLEAMVDAELVRWARDATATDLSPQASSAAPDRGRTS